IIDAISFSASATYISHKDETLECIAVMNLDIDEIR
ncbi:MAG: hypothetical protein RR575_12160, partial [Acinetobacter sp.]